MTGQVPVPDQWGPLPWGPIPAKAGYINNFGSLNGPVSGMPGQFQIKYNPSFYGQLKAFPEQATGIWGYLPGSG